ncbi:MAG: NAD-dependent epimerase/dehydratase family protein [Magnetococcales bacterium]|nr:NAD-dependent epimerase/dehydratase family protein [Magnetococcales bacterium]NGZ04994.1 NAD-dependent epimerase/dehydratase family protein [Magnetococcales bacterium]
METVLITGGAGAIGQNLCRTLLSAGKRVIVLDDLSSGHLHLMPAGVEFVQGSIQNDADLRQLFGGYRIDYLFHLAALFANQNSVDHPQKDLDVNALGLIKVLQYAVEFRVRKLLYTSSSCVYGNHPHMLEDDPCILYSWETPYAITKYIGEQYCRFWSHHHGLNTVIVRLFNSYGPGDLPGRFRSVVPNFMQLAVDGEPLPILGSGDEIRDFNYVEDTVQGIIKAMYSDTAPAEVFNLASGRGTRILDLAEEMFRVCGCEPKLEFRPRRSWDQVTRRVGIIDKAVRQLHYEPTTLLSDGLRMTHRWFLEHVVTSVNP